MMPAWLYTLGLTLTKNADIKIPFDKLIANLFITIIPCLIGMFAAKTCPKFKSKMTKYSKNVVVFLILTFFIFTIVVKFYIFELMTWQQWVAGPLVPWSGFILGGSLAYITKRPIKVITII
jgi:hypothetical protein